MPKVVVGLLFHSVSHAVYAARDSFFYALPAAACVFAAVWMWGAESVPGVFVALALFAAAAACTQFIIASIRKMTNPHLAQTYREAMRWTRASSDFFFFIALSFAAMGALSLFLLDASARLYEYSAHMSSDWVRRLAEDGDKHAHLRSSFVLLIFGSRTLAVAALLVAIALWTRLCRIGIQIPAHVEGYYLSPAEALEVTRGRVWHLLALSLIINGGLSAAGGAVITAMESQFESEVPPWADAAAAAGGLWLVGLLNAGYWTALYQELASGHVMRREIY